MDISMPQIRQTSYIPGVSQSTTCSCNNDAVGVELFGKQGSLATDRKELFLQKALYVWWHRSPFVIKVVSFGRPQLSTILEYSLVEPMSITGGHS